MELIGRRIAGFLLLAVGAVLAFLLARSIVQDVPIWVLGRKVPATIVETWWENFNLDNIDNKDFDLRYFFRYEFTTAEGEQYVGSTKVTEEEFLSYQQGSEVMIKYSPFNPDDNRLDDSRFVPFLLCTYVPFLLISLFALAAGREIIDF